MAAGCGTGNVFPDGEWQTAAAASRGFDQQKFDQAVAWLGNEFSNDRDGISQLVIVKDGYMIHAGDSVHKVHNAFSCTKSFTGIALGLLIDDEKCSENTRTAGVLPDLKELYPEITLAQMVSLTSGFRMAQLEKKDPSIDRFVPGTPVFEPGTALQYGPGGFNVLAYALTKLAGTSLYELVKTRIADRIGMDPDKWSSTFTFVVDELPWEAGIDPSYYLIDRITDDNLKRVRAN